MLKKECVQACVGKGFSVLQNCWWPDYLIEPPGTANQSHNNNLKNSGNALPVATRLALFKYYLFYGTASIIILWISLSMSVLNICSRVRKDWR